MKSEKQVFACLDGSSATYDVCDWAIWSAKQLNCDITLLHVLEKKGHDAGKDLSGQIGIGSREQLMEELVALDEKRGKLAMEQGKIILAEAKSYIEKKSAAQITTKLRHGTLVETLSDLKSDIQLVVIGHMGVEHQGGQGIIGSQVESVIRTLDRPIAVTRPPFAVPDQVMIAFDGSQTSYRALDLVLRTELLKGRSCHLVMVGDKTDDLEAAKTKLENAGHKTIASHREGDVETELWKYVDEHNIGLLVMGAYGHSRIRQFFVGSNTTKMLHHAKIPLVLLR